MSDYDLDDAVDEDSEHEDERDYWQEYKDNRAMGRIDEDGNHLDPWDEPNCFACCDSGTILDVHRRRPKERRCRACNPGRLRRIWWRVTGPTYRWWLERRLRRRQAEIGPDDPWGNEPPF